MSRAKTRAPWSSITNKSSQANLVKKTVEAQEEVNKFEADRKKINELEKGINIDKMPYSKSPAELKIKPIC